MTELYLKFVAVVNVIFLKVAFTTYFAQSRITMCDKNILCLLIMAIKYKIKMQNTL